MEYTSKGSCKCLVHDMGVARGRAGVPILGGNDAGYVTEISGGGTKLLKILYNVMQRPVSHNQRPYSTGTLR